LLRALLGGGSSTFELYLDAPRDELIRSLSEIGVMRPGGDRIALKWGGALASIGPKGAVLSLPTSASETEARSLFEAVGAAVRHHAWGLADGVGERVPSQADALLERFRAAALTPPPHRDVQRPRLNPSQRYALFLVGMIAVGLIAIFILRSMLQSFLGSIFGTM
jgi:hypothetical protein